MMNTTQLQDGEKMENKIKSKNEKKKKEKARMENLYEGKNIKIYMYNSCGFDIIK